MKHRPEILFAYLAGFFDGEGYAGVSDSSEGRFQAQISVCNTNREPLDYYLALFGGTVRIMHPGVSSPGQKQTLYRWYLGGRDKIKTFIKTMLPYSVVKAGQLELLNEFLAIEKSKRGMTEEKRGYADAIKRLNKNSTLTIEDVRPSMH